MHARPPVAVGAQHLLPVRARGPAPMHARPPVAVGAQHLLPVRARGPVAMRARRPVGARAQLRRRCSGQYPAPSSPSRSARRLLQSIPEPVHDLPALPERHDSRAFQVEDAPRLPPLTGVGEPRWEDTSPFSWSRMKIT